MNVEKALRELYSEKKILDSAISALETRLKQGSADRSPKRRGRKSMSAAERRAVSERMARYWQARRAQRDALQSAASASSGSSK